MDAVTKKYNDVNGGWAEANKLQKDVEAEDGKDEFCEKTNVKLTIIRSDLDKINTQVEGLKTRFAKSCDFWQLEAKSDLRESTGDFFAFFKKFAKDIEGACPKEEKKRAGAGLAKGAQNAQAAMMAELMRKQAAAAAK